MIEEAIKGVVALLVVFFAAVLIDRCRGGDDEVLHRSDVRAECLVEYDAGIEVDRGR